MTNNRRKELIKGRKQDLDREEGPTFILIIDHYKFYPLIRSMCLNISHGTPVPQPGFSHLYSARAPFPGLSDNALLQGNYSLARVFFYFGAT